MTRKITQVASEDAGDRGAWLKGSREDFPHLPLPPNQFFKEPIAAKQFKWLLKTLNLKRSEVQFPGWDFLINNAARDGKSDYNSTDTKKRTKKY